jgi:hypothetical protein
VLVNTRFEIEAIQILGSRAQTLFRAPRHTMRLEAVNRDEPATTSEVGFSPLSKFMPREAFAVM